MFVYQQLDVEVLPPACNFFKNETPAEAFSQEFCDFFQSVTLFETRLRYRCFLTNFAYFSACNFIKIETPAQALSCGF